MADPTPKLSEQLTGEHHPLRCQSCGKTATARWMEHDEQDRQQPIVVVLCKLCSNRLVENHPRLYREMKEHEPMPGAMPLCLDCRHRSGVTCTNPQAQINGGPGLTMKYPKPASVHVCRSPLRLSGWVHEYMGPVSECSGREVG